MARVVLIDEVGGLAADWQASLSDAGHEVVSSVEESDESVDVVVGSIPGRDAVMRVRHWRTRWPGAGLIVLSTSPRLTEAVDLMGSRISGYHSASLETVELQEAVARAVRGLHSFSATPVAPVQDAPIALMGRNPRLKRLWSLIRTVAPTESTVLLSGQIGTGKEQVAEVIHRLGSRSSGPLIRFSCAAFSPATIEDELFGRAGQDGKDPLKGALRRAEGGTLLLSEVGSLPMATQVKLLRALQERAVTPVGRDEPVSIDPRIIATTPVDLAQRVSNGEFREDLYLRLNVIPIQLLPLSERTDDIPELAHAFLEKIAHRCTKMVTGFEDKALAALERYSWPGNLRELELAIERAVVLTSERDVTVDDLPVEVRGTRSKADGSYSVNTIRLSEVEEIVIRRVLARTDWNIKRSAEMLGITRATLYAKIKKLGLEASRPTSGSLA